MNHGHLSKIDSKPRCGVNGRKRACVFSSEIEHLGAEKEYSTAESHLTYHARVAWKQHLSLREFFFYSLSVFMMSEWLSFQAKFKNGKWRIREENRNVLQMTMQYSIS